jgi:hypothetical protein
MFELAPGTGWLALAYVAGTAFGLWINVKFAVGTTIDRLIDQGYLKHRKDANGEIEILKHNEE